MGKFTVSAADYRPCIVNGMEALFHQWEVRSWIVPPSPFVGGHSGGMCCGTYAIVEMADGTVREVAPEEVRFINNTELFERYGIGNFDGK